VESYGDQTRLGGPLRSCCRRQAAGHRLRNASLSIAILGLGVTGCGGGGSAVPPQSSSVTSTGSQTSPSTTDNAGSPAPRLSPSPAPGETLVACYPSQCGLHFQGLTLMVGPVYSFTAHLSQGSVPSFRVDNVSMSTDGQVIDFGDASIGLTDNQGNRTGEGNGLSSDEIAKSNQACLSTSTQGYKEASSVVPGYPVRLPRGVCLGFPGDTPPVVPTTLLFFDGQAIPLTPVGQ
jgi:hypothetical protein